MLKKLLELLENPVSWWGGGALIVAAGECKGAFFDKRKGGTISEWFWSLPPAVQFFIVWCMGGVFVHFIGWGRVVNSTTVNVEVNES